MAGKITRQELSSGLTIELDNKQPLDTTLTALSGLDSNVGILVETAPDTFAKRTITGTTNNIVVTNGDGVSGNPTLDIGSSVVTLTGTQTLTNKTLTTPKILSGGYIADDNGNEQISFTTIANAVNQFNIVNAATGNAPQLQVLGNDSNIDLNLVPKGTGQVKFNGKVIVSNQVSAYNTQLTTTSATNVVTYTPSTAGNFVVWVYYRIATAATVLSITCTYTDAGGSQTKTILSSASQAVGSYTCTPLFISSTTSAITVTATAGTANNAYISAAISMM